MASVRIHAALGYLSAYLLAVMLGRQVVLADTGLALFWPAAGVAAVWMLRGTRQSQVVLDGALLFLSTAVFFIAVGLHPVAAALFGLANLTQALIVRGLRAVRGRRRFTSDQSPEISTSRDLLQLIAGAVLAAAVGAPIGTAASWITTDSWSWLTLLGWVVRNACAIIVVAAAVHAVAAARRERRDEATEHRVGLLTAEPRAGAPTELVLAVLLTVAAGALVFSVPHELPIGYVVLAPSAWIGFRFAPVVGALHSLGIGTLALVGTYAGWGAFGAVDDLALRALVVQLFVAVTTAIVLTLSLTVTEKSLLNARLRSSQARATARAELLDAVTEAMADGLCVTDSWGHVVLANSAAGVLAGGDDEGRHIHDPDDDGFYWQDGTRVPPHDLPHARALNGERVPSTDVVRIDPANGHESILSVSAVPLRHSDLPLAQDGTQAPEDQEIGPLAVVLMHDVTRERAERRVLENFAGVAAHDLQGPLTAVLSWAEMAQDQLDDLDSSPAVASVRSSVDRIRESSGRMNQLITDLLNYTLAGSAELNVVSVPLDDLVASVVRDLGLRGQTPLVEHAPLGRVRADAMMTRQLFTNLIANAVKYVAPGVQPHVVIEATTCDGMREIRITDNGVGIPKKDRGHVFDSFFRSETTGEYPGTGLGLAICRRATDRHGGRISATTGHEGRGTTMIFTLPDDLPRPGGSFDGPFEPTESTSTEPSRALSSAENASG